MKRIAFYGGSFDPPHRGHIEVARALIAQFELDQFIFIPAFHAPHKVRLRPTSAYDRFAMLCLATANDESISVSRIELELPEKPFTVETLPRLLAKYPDDRLFFVMGGDSWRDIKTWREWQTVLSMVDHIVVTRPGVELTTDHVGDEIGQRIVDLRSGKTFDSEARTPHSIYFTDAVELDISATEIRGKIRTGDASWLDEVPVEVANYIAKYQIYS